MKKIYSVCVSYYDPHTRISDERVYYHSFFTNEKDADKGLTYLKDTNYSSPLEKPGLDIGSKNSRWEHKYFISKFELYENIEEAKSDTFKNTMSGKNEMAHPELKYLKED